MRTVETSPRMLQQAGSNLRSRRAMELRIRLARAAGAGRIWPSHAVIFCAHGFRAIERNRSGAPLPLLDFRSARRPGRTDINKFLARAEFPIVEG